MSTLPIKKYPADKASQVGNDSETVTGANVAEALDELKDLITESSGGDGNVQGPDDSVSTNNAMAAWDGTTGRKLRNTTVIMHPVTTLDDVDLDKIGFHGWFDVPVDVAFGSTSTIDMDAGCFFRETLTGDTTIAFSGYSIGQFVFMLFIQDSTGGRKITWPDGTTATINWNNSVEPVLDPRAGGRDFILLKCVAQDAYSHPIFEEVCRKTSAPRTGISAAVDGATVTFNTDISSAWKETLGGNRTLALAGTIRVGDCIMLKLKQDATGNRLVTWWSGITWAGGTVPTLSTAANASDWFGFVCTNTNTYDGFVMGQGL